MTLDEFAEIFSRFTQMPIEVVRAEFVKKARREAIEPYLPMFGQAFYAKPERLQAAGLYVPERFFGTSAAPLRPVEEFTAEEIDAAFRQAEQEFRAARAAGWTPPR